MLDNWSLNITPQITVTPVTATETTINDATYATTFTIGFPLQQLSGTYTIQLGPNILDQFGDGAGHQPERGPGRAPRHRPERPDDHGPLHRGRPAQDDPGTGRRPTPGQVQLDHRRARQLHHPGGHDQLRASAACRSSSTSPIPNDPDLTATLYHYDPPGDPLGQVTLFSGVGSGINTANFTNTVFDDNAEHADPDGSAPFFATFNPQQSLATAFAGHERAGDLDAGHHRTLDDRGHRHAQQLVAELPEAGADHRAWASRAATTPRPVSASSRWARPMRSRARPGRRSARRRSDRAPAPPRARSRPRPSGRVSGIAIDPPTPRATRSTPPAPAAASGRRPTSSRPAAAGPTWIPLTDFGPTSGVNIGGIAVFARNNDPNQSIIIAATGEGDTGTPGVGFLISDDGGATWNLDDSTANVDASGNLLPINSATRDREFVGDTSFKVAVDPKLTPSGQVIIYAALSGTNGGIWRSEDTGKTWQLMLAGQATDVVLDPDSGTVLNPDTGHRQSRATSRSSTPRIRGVGVYMSPNQGQVWNLMPAASATR